MAERLALFDVCGTLYDENTTYGFLAYYHRRIGSELFERRRSRWLNKCSPFFYAGALAYRLGQDWARTRLVATLKDASRQSLRAAARDYAEAVLPALNVQSIHDRLDAHRAAGDRIMLISNSLDIIIAAIAERLGVEHLASRLEYTGERCTGRIERDLTGRKAEALREAVNLDRFGEIHVYTDNLTDRDLVELSSHATVVIPSGRSDEPWRGHSCEFVYR